MKGNYGLMQPTGFQKGVHMILEVSPWENWKNVKILCWEKFGDVYCILSTQLFIEQFWEIKLARLWRFCVDFSIIFY